MPELPEVEVVRRALEDHLVGKVIEQVKVLEPKSTGHDRGFARKLKGHMFDRIARRGKLMVFTFRDKSDLYMLGHLKMTGQLIYVGPDGDITGGGHPTNDAPISSPHRHTRIIFTLSDGSHLYFNDQRKFGYMKIASKNEVDEALSKFGPEPIDPHFDCDDFQKRLQKNTRVIKAVLLDQKIVAGLGNIYVDEALFRARIHPERRANDVSSKEYNKLCQEVQNVLHESITAGGTTFQNFVNAAGMEGKYKDKLLVFGRESQDCPENCGGKIQKIRVAGRGTHFCPKCQK